MLRWIINRRLNAAEKKLGVSVDYLRHIARISLPAFFKFVKFMPLAEYRKKLPADAYHVARIVAVQQEDCGSCVQIEVNLARQDGVDAALLINVLNQDVDKLSPELANVYLFAKAISSQQDEPDLRELIRIDYGEEGLVELALAIAACRVFPTTKRALGYATSCSKVEVKL
ncbi:MAG: hypothetical protein JNJ77_14200 [Planctomycetia bacterium]|nr:hypothetical protein [Planctomycetia bacterium]